METLTMVGLRLARLPDRTPVKLTVALAPDLAEALSDYARLYGEAYGQTAQVADLVPAMLEAFLAGDRGFARARKAGGEGGRGE